ncbi:RNA polymerase sigma-70 factor [Paraflavitalea sp. CAU 1676]|uniref:RNA polymerase sigma-70 factor n=1 Tax=Paraflavitalea sp. CAU 1676 TaxID=3032598 RepID=UPI0023DB32D2|nr:RNA polymerase sigma-70 factor [Paraflavitalea sp. CAU 1676]MDF2189618.1 RNA polymerase sigma-70 factor [Paraflavitalea sp. CAU 1676]
MHEEYTYRLFQQAFNEHYEALCKYAFTLVKDREACEDIVQETFLRVWEKKKELIGTDGLNFYMFRAVRNNCLSYLEQRQKHAVSELRSVDLADAPGETNREKESGKDYQTLLNEAIENLPPKCREVFVLSRVSDLSYQQISDTLDISVKTVENHMGKALRILRSFVRSKQVCLAPLVLLTFY